MKIFILTLGTRGDVQPYVALGSGLKAAGHDVTVCASESFEPLVRGHGLNYGYMNDDVLKLIHSDEGRRMIDTTTGMWQWVKAARRLAKIAGDMHRRMLEDSWESARKAEPDLIVYHPKAFGAPHFAEELGVPVVMAVAMPLLVPTRAFPTVAFPEWKLGGWYNRLTYSLFRRLMGASFGKSVREWRASRGLPPQARGADVLRTTAGARIPVLHGYSRHVVPRPADWPGEAVVTGYWFVERDETWQPPERLRSFLDAGEAPVYVGFGSMAEGEPRRLTNVVVEALRRANVRGVIATDWGGLAADDLPETILSIEDAPHDWLFERVGAVVHHGGAGTTAAGLRAGRPTVVCPFIGDQPFWGRRVHALGVGSKPIPQKGLTAENLAGAIREVMTSQAIRKNAAVLGEKIRGEDGVTNAVSTIRTMLDRRTGSPAG